MPAPPADPLRALRRSARRLLVAAMGAGAAALPAPAVAAELRAEPSSLRGVFAGAGAGDTILLASGDYGTFRGAMKDGVVTLREQPGATATVRLDLDPAANIAFDGLTLTEIEIAGTRTRNITVRNSDIPGQTTLRTGELRNANILLDRNVHRDFDVCNRCAEGRVWLPENTSEPSGITISNSDFRGGLSDGIQNGSNGTRIIGNTFHDLESGSADGVHADAIQLYGSRNTLIRGNWFYNLPHGVGQIMAPDGADHEVIEDNVFTPLPGGETRPFAIDLLSDNGSIVRHNTLVDGECEFNLRCGILHVGSKSRDDAGRGTIVEDNILSEISYSGDADLARNSHNLFTRRPSGASSLRATPRFGGGSRPTDYAGFALASWSPGAGTASDGLDRGIRLGARPPAADATARVLSRLRSIGRSGRVRLRVTTSRHGRVRVSGSVRPGRPLAKYRRGHSRKVVGLRRVTLRSRSSGHHTATLRVGPRTRRWLRRSRDARLRVTITINGRKTRVALSIRR